jgi:hypothetical protein
MCKHCIVFCYNVPFTPDPASLTTLTLYWIAFRNDVKKHLSVPFRNAIFRGIIATERCCFAQLLKAVHSVSDRCFFAPLRKAIRYSGNLKA